MDRRDFIRNTTGAGVALTAASYSRVLGANDRIGLALIGCGGRGEHVMKNCMWDPAVEVVALCDVWDERVAERRLVAAGAPTASPTTGPSSTAGTSTRWSWPPPTTGTPTSPSTR
jgi:hypothetical protein